MRRFTKIAVSLLLLAIVSTVCAFLLELVARALFRESVVLFPRYHTGAQYNEFTIRRLRPNSTFRHTSIDGTWEFRTNKQGYRNDYDFVYDKRSGMLRVLVLGDSHTQGFEVEQEETYTYLLQELLSTSGVDAEVMNVGVSGFSTAESLIYLEQEGIRYKPDVVILGFFANDYEDNIKAGLYGLSDTGELELRSRIHTPGVRVQDAIYSLPFTKWLGENSYAYSIAFNLIWDFAKQALSQRAREEVTEYAVATKSTHSEYEVDLAAAIIQRIRQVSNAEGASFVLVDIPQKGNQGKVLPSVSPQLASRIGSSNDQLIDVARLLSDTALEQDSHLPRGHQHISPSTHRVIAESLEEAIRNQHKLQR